MRTKTVVFVLGLALCGAIAQPVVPQSVPAQQEQGPAVGQKIPPFTARDQFGRAQTLQTLAGPRGLVLLFVRSADW